MDDVKRQIASLRARLRFQTIIGAGALAILAFALGGADVVARTLVPTDSGWKVQTNDDGQPPQLRPRLSIESGVATAKITVSNANLELAQQTTDQLGQLTPSAGAIAYDSTAHRFKYFNGSSNSWVEPQVGPTVVVKPSDESVSSSTALQDDDHLKFTVGTNEKWTADFWLQVAATSATPDIKLAITAPSGASIRYWVYAAPSATDPATQIYCGMAVTSGSSIGGGLTNSTTQGNYIHVEVENGATAGNVTLQWAQSISDATAVTMKAGSRLEATKLN